jgi:isoleucyl-tRNA synthetase
LVEFSKVIAPFMPFMAEDIWQKVKGYNYKDKDQSVHLEAWPKAGPIDRKILEEMEATRRIVELGLRARDEAGIKVRQPLAALIVTPPKTVAIKNDYIDLIKDEVNVKTVEFKGTAEEIKAQLDTELTDELRLEGIKRELVRAVNSLRKQAGLSINDRIAVTWQAEGLAAQAIKRHESELAQLTLADRYEQSRKSDICQSQELNINGQTVQINIAKL